MKTLAFFFALITSLGAKEKSPSVTLPELKIREKIYQNATITLRAANEAKIIHQDGTRTLNPALLPEDVQKSIGYSAEASARATVAQALLLAQEVKKNRLAQLVSQSSEITAKVMNSTEAGLLCMKGSEVVFVETETKTGYLSDKYYKFQVLENGTFEYTTVLGASKNVRKFIDVRYLNR